MKLLVTGGSGFLGSGILKRAPKTWQIAATYLTHSIAQANVAVFCVDVRDADAISRCFDEFQPNVVIHTAAAMSGDQMVRVNVDGSRLIARACARGRARLIHLSSDVVFDGEHAPYDESAAPDPISPYGESKTRAEHAVLKEEPRAVLVRTSLIYGFAPMDPRTHQTLAGEMPFLFTDEYRCPVYVDDLADALLQVAQNDFAGVINLAGPQRLSRYEFGLKLANAYRVEPRFAAALSKTFPGRRPRDCTLDISLAQRILRTPLRGVDKVIASTLSF
ncbi:MAG TPA: SDR family oxidoreductase [Anaerolineae bacterium]